MKKLSLFYVLALVFSFYSCDDDDDNFAGNGNIIENEDSINEDDDTDLNVVIEDPLDQIVPFYEDIDRDGLGNENVLVMATEPPVGYVEEFGDFDDNNADVQTIQDASLAVLLSLGGDDTSALETYVNQDVYIQHNQSFLDGVGFVIGGIQSGFLAGTTYQNSRIITDTNADGDTIVILHGIYGGTWNGGNPQVAFDVFRFDAESGLIEEHWDNLIVQTDPLVDAINGNTQLDGEALVTDLDQTDANKTVVQNFLADVLVGGMWSTLGPNYFGDSGEYIQHSPGVDNGIELFDTLGDSYQKYDDESPRFMYGEGNFVLTMSQGKDDSEYADIAFYDLFRLVDGKIVEHWDIIQDILAVEVSANTNGKW